MSNILAFFFAAVSCWFFLFSAIPYFRRRLLDKPNLRSSHYLPTPRGGGIVFVVLSCISGCLCNFFVGISWVTQVYLIAFPLAIVGFLDDFRGLSARFRYGVQLITATLIVFSSPFCQYLWLFCAGNLFWFSCFFLMAVFSVSAIINFVNFMDGLDGLVAGCMTLIVAALAVSLAAPWSLWALVGLLFGFLFWNWSPATIFMGDVGSTFLGSVFAALILHGRSFSDTFVYLLLATPLLGDAFFCVLRRLLTGQSVFQAHRLHLFQRLHQAGWPHSRVSLTYISATGALAVAMLVGGWPWVVSVVVLLFFLGVWLDQRVAVPFSVVSRS